MFWEKARRIKQLETDAEEMRRLIIEQSSVISSLRKQNQQLQERLNPEPKVPEPKAVVSKTPRYDYQQPKRSDESAGVLTTSYASAHHTGSDSYSSYSSSCDSGSSSGGDSGGSCGGGGGD